MVSALHHAGKYGVPIDKLVEVAGFEGGADPTSQINRELRHLKNLGWQIDNVSEQGVPAVYVMKTVDNRLTLRLTPAQQAALQRAVLVADRGDLAERLGLAASSTPAEVAISPEDHDADLALAIHGVRQGCRVGFRYNGVERLLHPESVRAQNGNWYLRGCEDGSSAIKTFRVSRMDDVRLDPPGSATRLAASRHDGLHPMTWQVDPPVAVTLRTSVDFAPDVRRWLGEPSSQHPDERSGEHSDERSEAGAVRMTYVVTHRAALRSRIHQLGTRVTLVGPDDVRTELLDELASMAGE